MHKQDEIAFQKQLNDFEAAMQSDLDQRSNEIGKKWEFDFSLEQPLTSANSDTSMNKMMMTWEPVKTEDVPQAQLQATRPRLQIQKPKMNISSMLNNTKASTPGLGQVYGGGFGLDNNRSSVLFSQSAGSESTVGDSMFGGSILSSVGGKSSIVDFNTSSGAPMAGLRRTSIALNMQQPDQNRRKTLQQAMRPAMENIQEIDNNRPSMLAAHEEGSINDIKPTINAGGKCFAEVNNAQAASQQEEFKDSVENNGRCDSFRSGSGSASGRQFNVIGGFTEEDSSRAPFEPENGAMQASGQMNNQPLELNAAEEEDDDCNLGESEEQSLPRAPVQYAGVNNKNQASLGRSNM